MRGANPPSAGFAEPAFGTSPHAWGKRSAAPTVPPPLRYIPTCVGQTTDTETGEVRPSVHPHMRGANLSLQPLTFAMPGTSPHAWGKRLRAGRIETLFRYIPTCVGQTLILAVILISLPVHPHMRGANVIILGCCQGRVGTSPHAWGKHEVNFEREVVERYIPTCVGQTQKRPEQVRGLAVHPHMRGANFHVAEVSSSSVRYIPTCVGQTQRQTPSRRRLPVHPHMRGANALDVRLPLAQNGTSPHAWGKQSSSYGSRPSSRYIPTCVGQTLERCLLVRLTLHSWKAT